jgi:hypothetical protein
LADLPFSYDILTFPTYINVLVSNIDYFNDRAANLSVETENMIALTNQVLSQLQTAVSPVQALQMYLDYKTFYQNDYIIQLRTDLIADINSEYDFRDDLVQPDSLDELTVARDQALAFINACSYEDMMIDALNHFIDYAYELPVIIS